MKKWTNEAQSVASNVEPREIKEYMECRINACKETLRNYRKIILSLDVQIAVCEQTEGNKFDAN